MPIYEYKCEKCGNQTEKLQKFDDPPPSCETPTCEHQEMKRLISRTTFELVGSGWAKDGYGG